MFICFFEILVNENYFGEMDCPFDSMMKTLNSSGIFLRPHISNMLKIMGYNCMKSLCKLNSDTTINSMELMMRNIFGGSEIFDNLSEEDKELYFGPVFKKFPTKFCFMPGDKATFYVVAALAQQLTAPVPEETRTTRNHRRVQEDKNIDTSSFLADKRNSLEVSHI